MTPWLDDGDVRLYHGDCLACECGCGTTVVSPDSRGRPRRYARGHNLRVRHPLEGRDNWWKGRRHSSESRAKLSAAASRPKPWLRGSGNGMAGRTGATNPNWKGGVTPERQALYSSAEWKRVARQVRVRDGGCVVCHAAADTHIHHVRPFATHPELRLDPDNLVTLCREHHHAIHRKGVIV